MSYRTGSHPQDVVCECVQRRVEGHGRRESDSSMGLLVAAIRTNLSTAYNEPGPKISCTSSDSVPGGVSWRTPMHDETRCEDEPSYSCMTRLICCPHPSRPSLVYSSLLYSDLAPALLLVEFRGGYGALRMAVMCAIAARCPFPPLPN